MERILVLGAVSYNTLIYLDQFPRPESHTVFERRWHETVGGTGAGKALNLAKLGFPVLLHALIGADDPGKCVVEYLRREPLIEFHPDLDPQGTPRHTNLMDASGRRISIHVVPGTPEPDLDLLALEEKIAGCSCVIMSIVNYCRRLIPLVKKHQKPLWVDIHDYDGKNRYHQEFIEAADYLQLSSDSLPNYRMFMEKTIEQGKKMVICTHGKDGATGLTGEEGWREVPILTNYEYVDSNGAGDAFFAGSFYGSTKGRSLLECLRLGTISSGLCITSPELYYLGLSPAMLEEEYRRTYSS
jgi:sugar/nucleoside kinase (ribokinase family)